MVAGVEPNAENKLFVGGCPPGSGEEDLRALFEKHGQVEEVFVMRGGSRSGMACAFVRFAEQPMAQQAIDAIHGQHTLPEATEPLVVRWADAPGTRKRDVREGGRKNRQGGGGGGSGASRDGGWNNMVPMRFNGMSYGSYPQQTAQMGQMQAQQLGGMGGSFGATYYGAQHLGMEGCYSSGPGMMPYHHQPMMPYMDMSQANMPSWFPAGPPSPTMMGGGGMMSSMHGAYANNISLAAAPMVTAQRGA